jgi:hypothetical protein
LYLQLQKKCFCTPDWDSKPTAVPGGVKWLEAFQLPQTFRTSPTVGLPTSPPASSEGPGGRQGVLRFRVLNGHKVGRQLLKVIVKIGFLRIIVNLKKKYPEFPHL